MQSLKTPKLSNLEICSLMSYKRPNPVKSRTFSGLKLHVTFETVIRHGATKNQSKEKSQKLGTLTFMVLKYQVKHIYFLKMDSLKIP